jgi:GGDEF domain-containing protein
MARQGPLRRKTDLRPRGALFGPTPGTIEPVDTEAFLKSLDHALDASRRDRRFVTLIVLDLEPGAADDVVSRLATIVRHMIRETDAMWRTAARTFTLLLADADGPSAEPVVARLRLRLRSDSPWPLSMGRATAAPGVDPMTLIDLAKADRREIVVER